MPDQRGVDQHHRSQEIDPVEFGKLLSSVQSLVIEVTSLREQVASLQSQMSGGRGLITGLMLAAGGVGAGASHFLEKLFR